MTPDGRHPLDVAARHARWGDDGIDGDVIVWFTGTPQPGPLPDSDMGWWRHMAQRRDGLWRKVATNPHPLTWDQLLAELARSRANGVARYSGAHPPLIAPVELRPPPRRSKPLIPAERFPRLGGRRP